MEGTVIFPPMYYDSLVDSVEGNSLISATELASSLTKKLSLLSKYSVAIDVTDIFKI